MKDNKEEWWMDVSTEELGECGEAARGEADREVAVLSELFKAEGTPHECPSGEGQEEQGDGVRAKVCDVRRFLLMVGCRYVRF